MPVASSHQTVELSTSCHHSIRLTMSGTLESETSFKSDCDISYIGKEVLFKILVIGDYGVGKTAIVRRYTEDRYSSSYKITIGADFSMKTLLWNLNTKVKLQLWDIAGHERFGNMTRVYYKHAVAAVIVFDVSRTSTFESAEKWLKDLRSKVTLHDGEPIPVVLLANKCDIEGARISTDMIMQFCKQNDVGSWFITSAKENVNIDAAISYLVGQVFFFKQQEVKNDTIILMDSGNREEQNKNNFYCCI